MPKEVKILRFSLQDQATRKVKIQSPGSVLHKTKDEEYNPIEEAEKEVARLLNDGWVIIASGGAGAGGMNEISSFSHYVAYLVFARG